MRLFILAGLALGVLRAQAISYITAGELNCGVRKIAPNSAQTFCYQGTRVVFNAAYLLKPSVSVTVGHAAGSDVVVWVLSLKADGTAEYTVFAGAVNDTNAGAMAMVFLTRDLLTDPIELTWNEGDMIGMPNLLILRLTSRKSGAL